MLRLLNLMIILFAAQVWASSGFLDDDAPAGPKTPAVIQPAPARPLPPPAATLPTPHAPVVTDNFPKCPNRSTKRADVVQKMIEQILGIQNPWNNTLASDRHNSFTLINNRNELQVVAKVDGTDHLVAATMCHANDGIVVKLVATGFLGIQVTNYIKVRPVNAHQVHITSFEGNQENPDKAGIFSSTQARR